MLALVAELNMRRIGMVLGRRAKRLGAEAVGGIPADRLRQLVAVRRLHIRYSDGIYKHAPNELAIVKDVCQWLVDEHAANQGNSPKTLTFDDSSLIRKSRTPLASDRYIAIVQAIASGQLDPA